MGRNDDAWAILFERHNILEEMERNGFFEISANEIRTVREPRLMAKFDHRTNLPEIFQKHGLSILPMSRNRYIVGRFNVYQPVEYNTKEIPIPVRLPDNITTIDPANLYSESAALHCAYVAGMIDNLVGEKSLPTVSGRMSSASFDFSIETRGGAERTISVSNSQIEIDGGYETENYILVVEAKKETTKDFLIRQLYYPYRLWQSKTYKEVKPVFFTHSNDIFSFFVYEFTDPLNYNSLRLLREKHYTIEHEEISLADIESLIENYPVVPEPAVPFPQADRFVRVVDLLNFLFQEDLTKDEITSNYSFDSRQTNYYTSAGIYLGLIERFRNEWGEVSFTLSKRGIEVMRLPYKAKYLALTNCILRHDVFRQVFQETVQDGHVPDKSWIVELMRTSHLYHVSHESTYIRRAQTIAKWIEWILRLPFL